VDKTIKYPAMSKLAEYSNDLHEAKYASHKREPLGKPMPRGYAYPQEATKEEFRFGVKTLDSMNVEINYRRTRKECAIP